METYYVNGKSKKEVNDRLAKGKTVMATCHSLFNGHTKKLTEVDNGSSIKIFEKYVGGSPYAKSYGTWNAKKQRIK